MWFFKYALINGQNDWTSPEEGTDMELVRRQHDLSLSQLFLFGPFETRESGESALDTLLAD